MRAAVDHRPAGRGHEEPTPSCERVCDAILAARHRARRSRRRPRRRRRRRSRRLRRRRSCAAACASCRCRPRSSPRSIPPSAARPASTRATARTSSAPSISRGSCSPTPALLDTLPPREFRAGYAEVVKYGLIDDAASSPGSRRTGAASSPAGPSATRRSAQLPRQGRASSSRDEREDGDRALLNLGHTFGHALEARTGYFRPPRARRGRRHRPVPGLPLFGAARPLPAGRTPARVEAHLRAVGLPTRLADMPGGVRRRRRLLDAMAQDKKVKARRADLHPRPRHRPGFIAPRHRGRGTVRAFLHDESATASDAMIDDLPSISGSRL